MATTEKRASTRTPIGSAAGPPRAPPEKREADQVEEAADPDYRPDLMQHGTGHERAAVVQPAHRVGEPRRVHHQEEAQAERHRPGERPVRAAAHPPRDGHQGKGQRDAAETGQAELGGEELAQRPAPRVLGEGPGMDEQQEEQLRPCREQCPRRDEGERAPARGGHEPSGAGRRPQHQPQVDEAAHRRGEADRPEAAQQDVEKARQLHHAG
jgi:hypothetical protein